MTSFAYSLFLTFFGCVLNNIFLEFIVSDKVSFGDKRAGPLLTLIQYAFIALLCLPQVLTFDRSNEGVIGMMNDKNKTSFLPRFKKLVVPFSRYIFLAALFALMSWLNNLAFAFRVSQPLHVVFRSANLMVTFLFGRIFFQRKYTNNQFLLIVALTVGALSNTLAEAMVGDTRKKSLSDSAAVANLNFTTWLIGVFILVAVMCLQTLLGEMQSRTSTQFGKAGDESTFFMHLLSVPVLLLLVTGTSSPPFLTFENINERLLYWSQSPPAMIEFTRMANIAGKESISLSSFFARFGASIISVLGLGHIPVMYIFVGLNVITQYIGITGVYQLVEVCDPLTVNVLLTVRKAISVVGSILLFGNTFTTWHCLGAIIVFSSSILWAKIPKAVIVEPSPLLKVIETRRGRINKTQALIVDIGGDREGKVGNGKTPTIESSSSSSSSRSQSKSPRNKKRRD